MTSMSADRKEINVGVRIGGFVAVLVAIFAAATLAGAAIDPDVSENDSHEGTMATNERGSHQGPGTTTEAVPGLAVAAGGYRLEPEATTLERGQTSLYSFRIVTDAGKTLQDFDTEHERRMHLIVVRRDFASFQHLHPEQLNDGSWQTDLRLSEGGAYRVFADFASEGRSLTLATDLFVAGEFDPVPLPAPETSAGAGDGYEVTLDSTAPSSGSTTPARFTVMKDGRELDSVEPYLGADGHLVALREHDQAFLHTHPQGEPGGPGPISFAVEYPSAGRYRLFLQFKHDGEVRTAAFTQDVSGVASGSDASQGEAEHGGH